MKADYFVTLMRDVERMALALANHHRIDVKGFGKEPFWLEIDEERKEILRSWMQQDMREGFDILRSQLEGWILEQMEIAHGKTTVLAINVGDPHSESR